MANMATMARITNNSTKEYAACLCLRRDFCPVGGVEGCAEICIKGHLKVKLGSLTKHLLKLCSYSGNGHKNKNFLQAIDFIELILDNHSLGKYVKTALKTKCIKSSR
jgi:hypothetical protein